jgi:hypothetical protein
MSKEKECLAERTEVVAIAMERRRAADNGRIVVGELELVCRL